MRTLVCLVLTLGLDCNIANAADCRSGTLSGSPGTSGPPDENIQCKVLGRIFCSLEDYRASDIDQDAAVDRTADWISHLGQTGSHLNADYHPAVKTAAAYIWAHDKMPPWTAYNYAVWTCGVNQRIPDSVARKKIADPWENAAQDCMRQYPGEGDGSGNEKLKRCLRDAMENVVKPHQVVKK